MKKVVDNTKKTKLQILGMNNEDLRDRIIYEFQKLDKYDVPTIAKFDAIGPSPPYVYNKYGLPFPFSESKYAIE